MTLSCRREARACAGPRIGHNIGRRQDPARTNPAASPYAAKIHFADKPGKPGSVASSRPQPPPGRSHLQPAASSARRPAQRPAAEQVRVHVIDGLTRVRPGVEDHPVAALADPLALSDLARVLDKVTEQVTVGGRERGQVGVVLPRDYQHVHGGLRVDVAEGESPRFSRHDSGRYVARGDAAEKAVRHGEDLNV